MKVIIDTNALIYAIENKIDLFQLLQGNEPIIPNLVLEELQLISRAAKKASDRKAAFMALKVMEYTSFEIVHLHGETDKALAELAKSVDAAVLTNDLLLKRKLAKLGVKVLHIRQKKLVEEWA
jgi:rRNA-processing protein FCF1